MTERNEVCSCGRSHTVATGTELIGTGAISRLGQALRTIGLEGPALLVADGNTWQAAGPVVEQTLDGAGIAYARHIFPVGELHTDERTVGSILMALDDGIRVLVAVGSGTINDACRFVAKRTGLPYFVVATAPSMDGYASDVTPVNRDGMKITYPGVAPLLVVSDTDILKQAPTALMAAGFGDLFGKVSSDLDWQLAHRLLGEYRCDVVAAQVERAVEAALSAAPGLVARDGEAVQHLMDGLVLSGVAMQMVGNSRPASGAEHHISHFWEMRDMARGRPSTLHGDKVGVAALMTLRLWEKFFASEKPPTVHQPDMNAWMNGLQQAYGALAPTIAAQGGTHYFEPSMLRRLEVALPTHWQQLRTLTRDLPTRRLAGEAALRSLGAPVRPADLGYNRQDMLDALRWAMEVRERFTVLRLAWLCGRLDQFAEEIVDEFCQ